MAGLSRGHDVTMPIMPRSTLATSVAPLDLKALLTLSANSGQLSYVACLLSACVILHSTAEYISYIAQVNCQIMGKKEDRLAPWKAATGLVTPPDIMTLIEAYLAVLWLHGIWLRSMQRRKSENESAMQVLLSIYSHFHRTLQMSNWELWWLGTYYRRVQIASKVSMKC